MCFLRNGRYWEFMKFCSSHEATNFGYFTRRELGIANDPEGQVVYKTRLQILTQRKFKSLPVYNCIREGPPHSLWFKATVTIDGQSFESPQFCHTLREAEHAAAKIALIALMVFPPEENQQDELVNYKNILQELVQKEQLKLPTYQTVIIGASHAPIFSSIVEIEGENFERNIARTKKLAEANAAKVAWCQLKERRDSRVAARLYSVFEVQDLAPISYVSATSSSTTMLTLQQPRATSVQAPMVKNNKYTDSTGKDHKEGLLAQITDKNDLNTVNMSLKCSANRFIWGTWFR